VCFGGGCPKILLFDGGALDFLAFLFTFGAMPKVNAQPASGDLKQKRKSLNFNML
jgi:hypothetical protein